jgi:ribosomal protein L37E
VTTFKRTPGTSATCSNCGKQEYEHAKTACDSVCLCPLTLKFTRARKGDHHEKACPWWEATKP